MTPHPLRLWIRFKNVFQFLRFVPDLEDIISFDELVKDEGLSDETEAAAK